MVSPPRDFIHVVDLGVELSSLILSLSIYLKRGVPTYLEFFFFRKRRTDGGHGPPLLTFFSPHVRYTLSRTRVIKKKTGGVVGG